MTAPPAFRRSGVGNTEHAGIRHIESDVRLADASHGVAVARLASSTCPRDRGFATLREKGVRSVDGNGDTLAPPRSRTRVVRARTAITATRAARIPPTRIVPALPPVAAVGGPAAANRTDSQGDAQLATHGFTVARLDDGSTAAPGEGAKGFAIPGDRDGGPTG